MHNRFSHKNTLLQNYFFCQTVIVFLQKIFFRSHLAEGEVILFVAHKHWLEIFKPTLWFLIFGVIVPWFLWALFPPIYYFAIIWTILAVIYYLYVLTDWYFDAWLVTNVSMIDVEWKGVFHRLSSRIDFNDIKEIAYEKKGVLGTILNFGPIYVSLASGDHVALQNANNPKNIELMVQKIREEYINQQKMSNSDALQDLLIDIVQRHISEKGFPGK